MNLDRMTQLLMLFCAILLFLWNVSYSQDTVNPKSKKLTDSAATFGRTASTYKTAALMGKENFYKFKVNLLNKAISLDSNNYSAYWWKFMFQDQMANDSGVVASLKQAIRLRPDLTLLKYKMGLAYDRLGDSVSARPYYESVLNTCNKMLDTMPAKNKQRLLVEEDKINVLILLGEKKESQEFFNSIHKEGDDSLSDSMLEFFIKRTRMDIINKRDILVSHL